MDFDVQEILLAALNGKSYIKDFSYKTYEAAFLKYKGNYSSVFVRILAENEPQQLADDFFRGLEDVWSRKKLGRKETILETKMVITLYLTPLLLQLGDEGAAFAEALCQKWEEERPGDGYKICAYEQVEKSFHRVFLGFDLGPAKEGWGLKLFKKS